jgi:glycosyltransferase involved in cell wall biosynthesis
MSETIGLVAIGRNEGERLRRCLESAVGRGLRVVYVDSGSTDGSTAMARAMGVDVVDLDLSIPFTAARARNAGFEHLLRVCPNLEFVQFVDGDCVINDAWLAKAEAFLRERAEFAVVTGRRRERFPEASIYNRLTDVEWHTPIGEMHWCGGDTMMRASALKQVNGFDPSFIAGEEPELCVRLREKGWKIYRLDAEMTLHDADMHHFRQWWRRMLRTGYAFAEGARTHGHRPERYWVRDVRSGWIYGLILPALALALAWPTRGISVAVAVLLYGVVFAKLVRHCHRSGIATGRTALLYSFFSVLGKLPQAIGQLRYWSMRIRGKKSAIIEYKGADAASRSLPPQPVSS